MVNRKLVFSTSTNGNGELARSNKNFTNKVKVLTCEPSKRKVKSELAKRNLEKLFN